MIDYFYLTNCILQLLIAVFSFAGFCVSKKRKSPISIIIGLVSLLFTFKAIISFFWAFQIFPKNDFDLLFFGSFFTFLLAVLLLFMTYNITKNKLMIYLFIILNLCLLSLYLKATGLLFIEFVSLFMLLILFFDLEFDGYGIIKKVGRLGILYSVINLLMLLFIYRFGQSVRSYSFIAEIIFVYIAFLLYRYPLRNQIEVAVQRVKEHFLLNIIRFILFITALNVFIAFGTLSIHELGNALAGKLYGCEYKTVLFESETESITHLQCQEPVRKEVLIIYGILAPLLVASLFFVYGKDFTTSLAYLIFGYGIIVSFKGFTELGFTNLVSFVFGVVGAVIVTVGMSKIVVSYLKKRRDIN